MNRCAQATYVRVLVTTRVGTRKHIHASFEKHKPAKKSLKRALRLQKTQIYTSDMHVYMLWFACPKAMAKSDIG